MNALNEVKPAFGLAEDELSAAITNGIVKFGDEFTDVFQSAQLLIEQVRNSSRTPIVSILLDGKPGAGKTALAAKLALESQFAFVKLLSPDNFVGYQEQARVMKIAQVFICFFYKAFIAFTYSFHHDRPSRTLTSRRPL